MHQLFNTPHQQQLLINRHGKGGSGKSYLINLVSSHLQQLASRRNLPSPVLQSAPTGIAAFGIKEHNIHSLLKIPISSSFPRLGSGVLTRLQADFRDIHILIIDEKSMISLRLFHMIDDQLRQIKATDLPTSGLHVLLSGDFCQLSPVADKSLFVTPAPTGRGQGVLDLVASLVYKKFDKTLRLQTMTAFAITINKSQGIKLNQVVPNISARVFQLGLRYVAVSCVKTLQGLTLQGPYDYSTLQRRKYYFYHFISAFWIFPIVVYSVISDNVSLSAPLPYYYIIYL